MISYLIYAADGTILQVGRCDDATFEVILPHLVGQPDVAGVLQVAELPFTTEELTLRCYVDSNVIRPRVPIQAIVNPGTILADGIDLCEITGLPIPCNVAISGAITVAPFVLSDGVLDITSDVVGDILVSVTAGPPWLAWSVTVSAT